MTDNNTRSRQSAEDDHLTIENNAGLKTEFDSFVEALRVLV